MILGGSKMRVLIIADLQFPYEHPNALNFYSNLKDKFKPDIIVQIGDLIDNHHASHFLKEVTLPNATEEISQVQQKIKQWGKVFPKMIVLKGNHEARLEKAMQRVGLPSSMLKTVPEIFAFPKGWEYKTTVKIDNVLYTHFAGIGGKHSTRRTAELARQPIVQGHLHKSCGIEYHKTEFGLTFCMTVGGMINETSPAFNYYGESNFMNKPIPAGGFVDEGKYPWLEVMYEEE